MKSTQNDSIISNYAKLVGLAFIIALSLRVWELTSVILKFGFSTKAFFGGFMGLFFDLAFTGLLLSLFFPFYFLTFKIEKKFANSLFYIFAAVCCLVHFGIVKYYLYQLVPLDVFVFQYTASEVIHTVNTSDVNVLTDFLLVLTLVLASIAFYHFFIRKAVSRISPRLTIIGLAALALLWLGTTRLQTQSLSDPAKNKTAYFIARAVDFFVFPQAGVPSYSHHYFEAFKRLYPHKEFLDQEYPLIHKAERTNDLGKYLGKFDVAPNIVVLIVEGLGNDYIHQYQGSIIMPFLNKLKERSLYWSRCFTLGERSFAAVPTILGGLPYGEIGFLMLEKLPRHQSLANILNANGYYTSLFYGQGAWFHRKDRFFEQNQTNLIFDKRNFDQEYSKVIVGSDDYFWGFNDKDLFSQSFEVIDTLPKSQRFDIYFTGTSHSPYAIADEEHYAERLDVLTTKENRRFFGRYQKFIKAIMFVDDALRFFFEKYKEMEEYENTIFIITGDHPMSEIPSDNALKKYHVPLLIYSAKLNAPKNFTNVVSHLDIPETILTLLEDYMQSTPNVSTSLGETLFAQGNEKNKTIVFMTDNREIREMYKDGMFLDGNRLFEVDRELDLKPLRNKLLRDTLLDNINTFKSVSLYASKSNKIVPKELFCKSLGLGCFYSRNESDTIVVSTEYYDLTPQVEVPNTDLIYEISFRLGPERQGNVLMVYEVKDQDGNFLLWKNAAIKANESFFETHIKIDSFPSAPEKVFFKSHLWIENQNQNSFSLTDVDVLLRTRRFEGSSTNQASL